jgi:hypothetical protein
MAIDTELEAQITADAKRPPLVDKLEQVRDKVRRFRDLEMEIADAEAHLKQLRLEKSELEYMVLPDLFSQNKVTHIGLEAEGNVPAYIARIEDYYKANISKEWPMSKREKAYDWLTKHKLGDIITSCITIELDLGTAKLLKKIQTALNKLGVVYYKEQSVHWGTLTAAVKEMHKAGKPLGDTDLRTIGATVGRVVKLKQKKGD